MVDRKQIIEKRWNKINFLFITLIFSVFMFVTLREIHLFFTSVQFYEHELLEYKSNVVKEEIHNRVDEITSIMAISETEFRDALKDLINAVDHFGNQQLVD